MTADPRPRSNMGETGRPATVAELHEQACHEGQPTYTDPATGYAVFTAVYLRSRGACCESGCRHCPFRGDRGEAGGAER